MAYFVQILSSLKQHMNAELTRSDVLRALIWPNGMLLTALIAVSYKGTPDWLLVVISSFLGFFMLLYAGAYIFFAATDPDALRSEKYKLQKLAIEQGLFGDSNMGLMKIEELGSQAKLIDSTPNDSPEHD